MRFFGFILAVTGLLYALNLALLVGAHRSWWRRRWVRRAALAVPVAVAAGLSTWILAYDRQSTVWIAVGAGVTSFVFAQLVALLLALLPATAVRGAVHGVGVLRRARRRRPAAGAIVPFPGRTPGPEELAAHALPAAPERPASTDRRRFLQGSLAALPLLTSSAAVAGTVRSRQVPAIPHLTLRYPGLPAALEGLRVLHLSDLHVGPYVGVGDIERLVERAAEEAPDLVLVTGDLCDHLPDYQATLTALEGLRPRLGTWACLGNHEYFRGIAAVRARFERSSIPLLVDGGTSLPVGDARLYLAGADDPRFLGDPAAHARLRASVEASLDGGPSDAFRILMSHRSQAFDTAAPRGVHLTLSGHTHGFQIGLGGRSLFERAYPERYIWGHYGGGATQLYTSSGVGHWFPFRLGCPPEAPLFTLTSATRESA